MSGVNLVSNGGSIGRSAFEWDVYKNRRTALQYLKRNSIHVDTIIETEDGRAHELVHSQVMSAFGDKLTQFIAQNGVPIVQLNNNTNGPKTTTTTAAAATTTSTTTSNQRPAEAQYYNHHFQIGHYKNSNNRLKLVRLPKINRYTLNILVDCAYSGFIRTDLSTGGIWQVLEMADYYEMADVQRACCTFLTKNLSASNCVHFYHIGIKHRHPLQRAAWDQIRANFKYILEANMAALVAQPREQPSDTGRLTGQQPVAQQVSSQTHQLQQQQQPVHPQGLPQQQLQSDMHLNSLATIKYEHFEPLLMHDKLNVDNEESVWNAIRFWCNHQLSERQHLVAKLLPCIRFPRLRASIEFSTRQIWRDQLILNNKQAQHQLAVLDRNHRGFISGRGRHPLNSINVTAASANSNPSSFPGWSPAESGGTTSGRGRGNGASTGNSGGFTYNYDGFNLPCAVNPRQLRPRIPHSILLAIGGWQQGQPTTLIESYDLNCNLWFESRNRIVTTLAYHGIECIEGRLYICGGTDGRDILNQMFTFDPVTGRCQFMKPMREDRCYVSTSYLDSHLYAMGGHNGIQRLRSVERYSLESDLWERVTDMNAARSDASACVHERAIYIAGGLNDQVIESSVEFYNPLDKTWTYVSSMLVPRTSFALVKYRNSLLAIGGNNGTDRLNSVEQYNFSTNVWSSHSQMRNQRSTFSAALVDEGKLFVVGGYNGQTPFAQVEMFDERSNQWIQMQKIRYDRSGLKLVVVKDLPNAAEYTFLGSPAARNEYVFKEASSPP